MAERSAADDVGPEQSDLEMPGGGTPNDLVVPAAMAVDERGWIAVAELKDEPGGRADQVAVWAGAPATPGPPATLELPDGHVLAQTVAAGRTDEVAVVVALWSAARPCAGTRGAPCCGQRMPTAMPTGRGPPATNPS